MHKTVKLGDASLQYTIVPQSEETIVDEINGKCYSNDSEESFCGSAAKKNRTHRAARSPSNYKPFRCRGAVVFILVTLALGCGIVIAAVLVPILVASKLTGYVPETVKFQTFAIAASSVFENSQSDQRQSRHRYIHLLPVKQVPSFDFSPNSRQHSVTAANNVTASNAANGEHSGERVTVAEQADHQNARSGDTTSVPSSGDSSAKVSSAVTDTGATHRVSMFTQYRQSRYQITLKGIKMHGTEKRN